MVLDSISSPRRISSSSTTRKGELGNWSTLVNRHRFLLIALILLAFLCTIYLYFAITLGPTAASVATEGSCSGMSGKEKALCRLEHAKTTVASGKLKFF